MFPWQSEYEFILSEFKTLITFQAKFNEMECIAILLKDMKQKGRKPFVLDLLDHIFEDIYRSLEQNDFKES